MRYSKEMLSKAVSILASALILGFTSSLTGSTEVDVRSAIASRIELLGTGLKLEPDGIDYSSVEAAGEAVFEPENLLNALSAVSGKADYVGAFDEVTADDETWYDGLMSYSTSEHCVIQLDQQEMSLAVRDMRGYDVEQDSEVASATSEEAVLEISRELLYSLGALPEEVEDAWVTYLMAEDHAVPDTKIEYLSKEPAPHVTRRVARKVFVNRSVGGIPVLGDRMVISFALDGGFRKMLGSWKRVDWSASVLGVSMDEEAFVERALDFLVDLEQVEGKKLSKNADLPIVLGTHYVPVEIEPGLYALELGGYAVVVVRGPADSTAREMFSFDLY